MSASSNLEMAANIYELAQEAVECIGATRIFFLGESGSLLTLFDFKNSVMKIISKKISKIYRWVTGKIKTN